MVDYSALHHAEVSKRYAQGTEASIAQFGGTGKSSKEYATDSKAQAELATTTVNNAIGVIQTEGNTQVDRVTSTGDTQVARVNTEGATQVSLASAEAVRASTEADRAETEAERAKLNADKAKGLEIGSLVSATLPILNNINYVLADGSQYSNTGAYQEFSDYLAQVKLTHPQCFVTQAQFDADVARTGQCGRYVLDTVNFRVPKITRFIGATINMADIGKSFDESLPNITGGFAGSYDLTESLGAFRNVAGIYSSRAGGGEPTAARKTFDASRSSPSYQDGAKNNVERITYPYYIVVSNAGQMTPVEIDINQLLNDVALKMDKNAGLSSSTALQNIASVSNAAGKATILSSIAPKFSKKVAITSPYTATEYTWVYSQNETRDARLSLNDETLFRHYANITALVSVPPILLSPGDVITWNGWAMFRVPTY